MNYRPKYIAVGAFAPERVAQLWRVEVAESPAAGVATATAAPRPRPKPATAAGKKGK